jgi:hypothetical protein
MRTLDDLIEAFGGVTGFGKACGYPENPGARGSDIKRRGSIPVERWPGLIEVARVQSIEGVTPEFLMGLHSPAPVESN